MNDPNRHSEFATWIRRRWKKAKTALVVADGKGELSRKLVNKGFVCRVIEAQPRLSGDNHPRLLYMEGWFNRNALVTEDIVVAMHPDEATAEVILAAKASGKPWAVVPC